MAKDNPAEGRGQAGMKPARQTGEDEGSIKSPQVTDATMAEKDLPRGSEKETHARK